MPNLFPFRLPRLSEAAREQALCVVLGVSYPASMLACIAIGRLFS